MKNLFLVLVFAGFTFACKTSITTDPTPVSKTPTQILSLNAWKIDRLVSSTTNKTLTSADYAAQAAVLFLFDFNFKDNNVVRASDRVSKQILNTGTWYLINNDSIMNFNLEAIGKIDFDVVKVTQQEVILRVKGTSTFAGLDNTVNMVLIPSL